MNHKVPRRSGVRMLQPTSLIRPNKKHLRAHTAASGKKEGRPNKHDEPAQVKRPNKQGKTMFAMPHLFFLELHADDALH